MKLVDFPLCHFTVPDVLVAEPLDFPEAPVFPVHVFSLIVATMVVEL